MNAKRIPPRPSLDREGEEVGEAKNQYVVTFIVSLKVPS